jgi:hypothetical protein
MTYRPVFVLVSACFHFRGIHPSPVSGWRVAAHRLYATAPKVSVQYSTLNQIKRAHRILGANALLVPVGSSFDRQSQFFTNENLFTSEQLLAFDTRNMQHAAKELRAVK